MNARSAVSALLVALLMGVIYYYIDHKPHRKNGRTAEAAPVQVQAKPFHGSMVAPSDVPMPKSPCAACHKRAPHSTDTRISAFLNLHSRALDCTACHAGGSFALSRDPSNGFIFAFVGAEPVKPPSVTGSSHVFGQGLAFAARGLPCSECHRRGSRILATPGLYDDYRRRLMEDLDVLPEVEVRR